MNHFSLEHYSLEQWTDFARNLMPAEDFVQMHMHRENCQECNRLAALIADATLLATVDRSFDPPPDVVAVAEAIFPSSPAGVVEGIRSRLRRLAGKLEWDSFGPLAQQGVRSLRPDARHVVYKAGRYSIDLILDTDPESEAVVLTGQVADDATPDVMPGVVNPMLLSGREVVASTSSTEFGEFALQYRSGRDLSLWIPMEQAGECIQLELLAHHLPYTEIAE